MAERPTDLVVAGEPVPDEPTRAELEARVEQARESITDTVEQIKDTVGDQIDAVASTVSGVLTMSEQFQREPVAWSLGALSAGFAMGYSLGRAHHATTTRGRPSPLARLADDVASELATFGGGLVSPELGAELKKTFGVDLSAALAQIAARQVPAQSKPAGKTKRKTRVQPKRRPARRSAPTKRKRS